MCKILQIAAKRNLGGPDLSGRGKDKLMQDNELIELIKRNPNIGLSKLMSDYMGLVCSIVREKINSVCDEFEMEACASDVFIDFYNNIDRFSEEKGSLKAFLCVIAKRRAIDTFRKKIKEVGNISVDDEESYVYIADTIDIEEAYIKREQKKALLEAINSLGEPDREIIVRKYYILMTRIPFLFGEAEMIVF